MNKMKTFLVELKNSERKKIKADKIVPVKNGIQFYLRKRRKQEVVFYSNKIFKEIIQLGY